MKRLNCALALATTMSMALWAAPSLAQDLSGGNAGSPEASRALPSGEGFSFRKAMPVPSLQSDGSTRALELDEDSTIRAFTAVGKTAAGEAIRIEPSDNVKSAVKGQLAPAERGGLSGDSIDPLTKTEDGSRQVFGADERVQVTNTKAYPYSVIGYLESKNKKGEYMMCTGTLIGPRTVLTAAHCVYDHNQEGGFSDDLLFVPGLAGPEDAPFGAYQYESVVINQGYIDNYKGSYGTVIPWDLAIITLKDPIGDSLGWLGYYPYPDLGNFEANIAGYQGDKPQFTMWRSRCDVLVEKVAEDVFSYDCDVYQGSSGSAVYAYDTNVKQRIIVGVNVASGPEIMNQAVRLNAANVAWIDSLNK